MNKILMFFSIFILCNSCTTQKNYEFYFKNASYKDNIEISEFSYDSSSGTLINRRPEKTIIKLSDEDKKTIYNFYKNLDLRNNSSCFTVEDHDNRSNYKIDFIIKSDNNKNKKCSTSEEEADKHLQLYIKIKNILHSKKEYEEAFPEEFEEL